VFIETIGLIKRKISLVEKHKICCLILCFIANRFNKHDFIENQATLNVENPISDVGSALQLSEIFPTASIGDSADLNEINKKSRMDFSQRIAIKLPEFQ
jgi:hypothetical protein